MAKLSLPLRSVPGVLLVSCAGVGALVLAGVLVLALAPMLIGLAAVAAWLVASLLLAWLGIEALAALERWLETDSRFQR
jgi:hypothetical protein